MTQAPTAAPRLELAGPNLDAWLPTRPRTRSRAGRPVTRVPTSPRRRRHLRLLGVEVLGAALVAAAARPLLDLPDPVLALVACGWPTLLLLAGHFRRRPLGEPLAVATHRILTTTPLALVLAMAGIPIIAGPGSPSEDLAWLAIALATTSLALAACLGTRCPARLVVAGSRRDVREALRHLRGTHSHQVVAVCLTGRHRRADLDLPTYHGLPAACSVVHAHAADALVVLPGKHASSAMLRRLQWQAEGAAVSLYVGTGLVDVARRRTQVVTPSGLSVLHVAPSRLDGPMRGAKDAVERLAALVGLLLLLPLLLAVGVAVRATSPGPALFRQERIGRDGRAFRLVKFRSMVADADALLPALAVHNEADGPLFKIQQDPRVTPFGRWLRRWSVDELPQLWNVVTGDMSLIGPRPALACEVARYDRDSRRRLAVKPGITGLWQVSGRSDLSWEESVRLDLAYVDNWSLRLDTVVLCRTVGAVVRRRGAY